jgi:hypothetical protein
VHGLVSKCHTDDVKETKFCSLSRFMTSGLFRHASQYEVGNAYRHLAGKGRAELAGKSNNQEQIFLNVQVQIYCGQKHQMLIRLS